MVGDNPRCEDTLRFHVFSAAVCALWLAHEPAHRFRPSACARFVICRLFSSHEETSEMPLSSSIVLRRFPPISDDRERTRSIWGEMRAFMGKCAAFVCKRAHF